MVVVSGGEEPVVTRSWDVTFVSVVMTAYGAMGALSAGILLVAGMRYLTVGIFVMGVAMLITGIGVFRLKPWAYWMTVLGSGIQTVLIVFLLAIGGALTAKGTSFRIAWWVQSLVPLSLLGFVLWRFLHPSVKAQFGRDHENTRTRERVGHV